MRTLGDQFLRAHEKLWLTVGSRDLAFLDDNRDPHSPSTVFSYYGSLGFMLIAAGVVLGARPCGGALSPPVTLALAAAPIIFALVLSMAIEYDPFRGRFFVFAMALAASTWGLAVPHRWLAWGAAAIALGTVPLSFVHSTEKPLNHSIFERGTSSSVWGTSRETVQTWLRQDGTSEPRRVLRARAPARRVGLRVRADDWIYPYFGRTLGRDVVFVAEGPIDPSLDWLVVNPDRAGRPGVAGSLALRTTTAGVSIVLPSSRRRLPEREPPSSARLITSASSAALSPRDSRTRSGEPRLVPGSRIRYESVVACGGADVVEKALEGGVNAAYAVRDDDYRDRSDSGRLSDAPPRYNDEIHEGERLYDEDDGEDDDEVVRIEAVGRTRRIREPDARQPDQESAREAAPGSSSSVGQRGLVRVPRPMHNATR